MAKRFELTGVTGADCLRLADAPSATLGARQVRIRVRATSLNYRDLMIANGALPGVKLPVVPLSDGAGEIIEVGAEVKRVKTGDRVMGIFMPNWIDGRPTVEKRRVSLGGPVDGMLAEEVVLDAEAVTPIPAHLSYEEAATLPCAAVTAWSALFEAGGLRAGDTALFLGTGGVSIFGMQLAQAAGARAIVTSSSDAKLERAKALGAWATINYKTDPDWGKTARGLTGGDGVDHVLEIGGAGTLAGTLNAVRLGGHVALIGARSGDSGEMNRGMVQGKNLRVTGIGVGSRAMFEAMNRLIVNAGIKPVIDKVYDFADSLDAYRDFAKAGHFGKVVIRIP